MYMVLFSQKSEFVFCYRCFTEMKGLIWKNWAAIQCLVYAVIAAAVFSVSLVSHFYAC